MVFDGRELEQQPVGIGHCLLALVIEEVLTNAKHKDKGQKNQNRGGNSSFSGRQPSRLEAIFSIVETH